MILDDIHYTFNAIDGHNKPFNFIVSAREDGKTTAFIIRKAYKVFKDKGLCTIILRRFGADITDVYIESIEDIINKFNDGEPVKFSYKRGTIKDGSVDIRINNVIFVRMISLNTPMSRLKSNFLKNVAFMFMDEFICNNRLGEKYLTAEAFKFKEIYKTYRRESPNLKCYFCGNPYSLYNPYFVDFNIEPAKLKADSITTGANWAVHRHALHPKLIEKILNEDPLHKFEEDAYSRYALGGVPINDTNITVMKQQPVGYRLEFVIQQDEKLVGLFSSKDWQVEPLFWCGYLSDMSARRTAYCFDFKDLTTHATLFSSDEKNRFAHFKLAMRQHSVAFQSLEINYMLEEIYKHL